MLALHVVIASVLLFIGLYVLLENKLLISGKLTGHIFEFEYPNNLLIAFSFFLQSLFSVMVLVDGERLRRINEKVLIIALLLFVVGVFI